MRDGEDQSIALINEGLPSPTINHCHRNLSTSLPDQENFPSFATPSLFFLVATRETLQWL